MKQRYVLFLKKQKDAFAKCDICKDKKVISEWDIKTRKWLRKPCPSCS